MRLLEVTNVENNEAVRVDTLKLKKASLSLRALNHSLRLQILNVIQVKKKVSVTDIYVGLRLEQSVVSQHLGILRRAGFVLTERDGKFVYYKINYKRIEFVMQLVDELLK